MESGWSSPPIAPSTAWLGSSASTRSIRMRSSACWRAPSASGGGVERDGVVGDDRALGVPLALDRGQARAGLGREDRVDVAGVVGEVEVAAAGGPGLHRRGDAVEV